MLCHRTLSRSVVAASLCSLLLTACAGTMSGGAPVAPQDAAVAAAAKPVARVNGREITRGELSRSKQILLAGQPNLKIPPYLAQEFEKQALDKLIGAELLFQAGRKLTIADLEAQTETRIAKIRSGFKDQALYQSELKKINLTEAQLRDYIRRDVVIANLVNTVIAPQAKVGEAEIETYYRDNPSRFQQEEQVRASHILIGVAAKASPEEKEKARAKAEKIRAELVAGGDFAKLAARESSCPSASKGGDLGYFGKGKMVPPFEQAAFALEKDELSPVVETEYGYHVIKLSDRIKGEKVPLAAAHQKLEAFLRTEKVNNAISDFVGEARKSAKVEILLP